MSRLAKTYWYFKLLRCMFTGKSLSSAGQFLVKIKPTYTEEKLDGSRGTCAWFSLQLIAYCILGLGCSQFAWQTKDFLQRLVWNYSDCQWGHWSVTLVNFSQQINGFSIPHTTRPPAPLFHHMLQLTHPWPLWADLFKHAQQYCYVQFSLSGALQFVSEISGERWSICCVFAAQAHCRSMSYVAELSCHFSYTLCSYSYIPNTTVYW